MRHGTLTMATTGRCSCEECRPVATRYKKLYRLRKARGQLATTSVEPSLRKVRALQRLGHTRASIAAEIGTSPQSLSNTLGRARIKTATAVKIDEVFRRLEMVVPPETRKARVTREAAARAGWPAPLAYDDIEQGVLATPSPDPQPYSHDRLDEEEVDYALQYHDFSRRLSPAEKSEIVRRWTASGRSERSLCRLTGWREGRYHRTTPKEAA